MAKSMSPPVPSNEEARLHRLRGYGVLDTDREEAFDRITRLAGRILGMPISVISLIDADRQWFKSKVGLDAEQTDREVAFCAHAICGDTTMVVENAAEDPRFLDNPLVTGAPDIRFYAGAPLQTPDGHNIGTLCVIDRVPRTLTVDQRQLLEDLAAIVIDELEFSSVAEREKLAQLRFIEAVEALPDGFVMYDPEDRLAICNQKYREFYAESADLLIPGARFEDIIRAGVARGQYTEAAGREEDWIRERMEKHRNPGEAIEQRLLNGRWLRIEERKTATGDLVGFRVDITPLKERELALSALAYSDGLTGTLTRRRFDELAEAEILRARRYGGDVSVLMVDIDHFKAINDRYGHQAGDEVLKALAERFRLELREQDLVGRMGGEEFAVLLPETDLDNAAIIAERLRKIVGHPVECGGDGHGVSFTISVGVSDCSVAEGLAIAFSRADEALYEAKHQGRDRVVMAMDGVGLNGARRNVAV